MYKIVQEEMVLMIFKPSHIDLILCGKKTATRRNCSRCPKVGTVHKLQTKFYTKEYFGKIKIIDVYSQKLGEMTTEDAIAEGYPSIEEYKEVFAEIYGVWNPNLEVKVITFEVVV